MRILCDGATRTVILTRRWAIKLPGAWRHPRRWRSFLSGLLANLQEAEFGRAGWPELCPIRLALPGGLLVAMPRATALDELEWLAFDAAAFIDTEHYRVPVELKRSSFGKLGGRVVAVDYG